MAVKKMKSKNKGAKKTKKSRKRDVSDLGADDAELKVSPEKSGVRKKGMKTKKHKNMQKAVEAALATGSMDVDMSGSAAAITGSGDKKGKRKRRHKTKKATAELLARMQREQVAKQVAPASLSSKDGSKMTFTDFLREFSVSEGGATEADANTLAETVVDLTSNSYNKQPLSMSGEPSAIKRLVAFSTAENIPLSWPTEGEAAPFGTAKVVMVCGSFQRVIDCAKEAGTSNLKAMKLFSKHKKMTQQAYDLERAPLDIAIGTPQRLRLLSSTEKLKFPANAPVLLVVDHELKDVKERRCFDDSYTRMEIGRLVLEVAKIRAKLAPGQVFKVVLV